MECWLYGFALIAFLLALSQLFRYLSKKKELNTESLRHRREAIEERIRNIEQEEERSLKKVEQERANAQRELRKEQNRLAHEKGQIRKQAREAEKTRRRAISKK